jgi:hypothetical protein
MIFWSLDSLNEQDLIEALGGSSISNVVHKLSTGKYKSTKADAKL